LWKRLEGTIGDRWSFHRCLVRHDRHEIAAFEREDGARVDVYYNQAHLEAGPCDRGTRNYFHHAGRLRPDLTVATKIGGISNAAVIEVKHTEDTDYMVKGFREAMLYRWEYAEHLRGWPKAILVTSASIEPAVRVGDDVIAVGWNGWVP